MTAYAKTPLLIVALVGLVSNAAIGNEHFTLVASSPGSVYGYSQTITLQQGDTAQGVSGSLSGGGILEVTVDGVTFEERLTFWAGGQEMPGFRAIKIVGAATLRLRVSGPANSAASSFVTVEVNRVGTPTDPVAIPIEAGANFNVVLESSSDLVNWQPTNPGTYTGTEVRRFFRVRIVRY